MDHITHLQKSLEETAQYFKEKMAAFEDSLAQSPSTHVDAASLASNFNDFRSLILKSVAALRQQMELVMLTLDGMEMRSRAKVLLLHGLAEKDQEDLSSIVAELCRETLLVPYVTPQNLSTCIRLGSEIKPDKPRPALLRFADINIRNVVWAAKKCLKGSGLTLSEFLTSRRHAVFLAARKSLGVQRCWTSDGKVVVVAKDGSRYRIVSMPELQSLQDKEAATQGNSSSKVSGGAGASSEASDGAGATAAKSGSAGVPAVASSRGGRSTSQINTRSRRGPPKTK